VVVEGRCFITGGIEGGWGGGRRGQRQRRRGVITGEVEAEG
jgi:hypothetical protein